MPYCASHLFECLSAHDLDDAGHHYYLRLATCLSALQRFEGIYGIHGLGRDVNG